MLAEKERSEGVVVAGMSEGKAESVFPGHARFKIRPRMPTTSNASRGFRNLGARVIPMKFNDNIKRVLFGAELFPHSISSIIAAISHMLEIVAASMDRKAHVGRLLCTVDRRMLRQLVVSQLSIYFSLAGTKQVNG